MSRVLLGFVGGAWFLLLWPFPNTVFIALCLSCALCPVYEKMLQHLKPRYALILAGLLLFFCILSPVIAVTFLVAPQAVNGLNILDSLRESGWFTGPEAQAMLDKVGHLIRFVPGMEDEMRQLTKHMADLVGTAVRTALQGGVGIAGSALSAVLHLFLLELFTLAGILFGSQIALFAHQFTGLSRMSLSRITSTVRSAIYGVLMGVLLVAVIQGILCGVGLAFAGVPQSAFWGLVATFLAPIPVIGTAAVWIPAAVWLWFAVSPATAAFFSLWCILVVAGVDNFLRPIFLVGGMQAPLTAVFLGVICGIVAFGPIGLLLGPVLVSFAIQLAREAKALHQFPLYFQD